MQHQNIYVTMTEGELLANLDKIKKALEAPSTMPGQRGTVPQVIDVSPVTSPATETTAEAYEKVLAERAKGNGHGGNGKV